MQDPLLAYGRRAKPWIAWGAAAVAAIFIATFIPHTLTIFAIAALIAFGTAPVVGRLERRVPRVIAVSIVYAVFVLALVILGLIIVPAAIAQSHLLLASAPGDLDNVGAYLDQTVAHLHGHFGHSFATTLDDVLTFLSARIETITTVAISSIGTVLLGTLTIVVVIISAVVVSAFFVSRSDEIADGFRKIFPPTKRHLADEFEHEIARVFGEFVAAQATLCFICAVLIFAGLTIIHFPFALIVALATAFGYAVPFVGMLVVQIAAAVLAAPFGMSTVVWVTVIIFVLSRIVDTVFVPKLMSDRVGVSPIAVMFAVFAGGEAFGLPGLVLGIPAAALARTLWMVYSHARRDAQASAETFLPDEGL